MILKFLKFCLVSYNWFIVCFLTLWHQMSIGTFGLHYSVFNTAESTFCHEVLGKNTKTESCWPLNNLFRIISCWANHLCWVKINVYQNLRANSHVFDIASFLSSPWRFMALHQLASRKTTTPRYANISDQLIIFARGKFHVKWKCQNNLLYQSSRTWSHNFAFILILDI